MFELPKPDEHVFTIGRNGTGKTQLGIWMLSESDFDKRPHFILDFKRDDLIGKIPFVHKMTTKDRPSKNPGIYRVMSSLNDPYLETFLENIWKQNNAHLHIDETYMVPPRSPAFNAILTQGRSKRVSMNCLSQRPSMCSRWIVSEAKKFVVFHLNDIRDKKTIEGFMPVDLDAPLKRFHSHWYDSQQHFYTPLLPAPDAASILERFNERLRPRSKLV
jgi:hypothetical protein